MKMKKQYVGRMVWISVALLVFTGQVCIADDTMKDVQIAFADGDPSASGEDSDWYNGVYINLSVGPTGRETANDDGGIVDFDMGIVGNVGVGYKFPDNAIGNLRMELEWSRFHNAADTIYIKAVKAEEDALDTTIDVNAFMANMFFDFKIEDSKFKPFVGVGAGMAQGIIDDWETNTLNNLYNVLPTIPDSAGNQIPNPYLGRQAIPMNQDTDYVGAIQFRAGLSYEINDNFDVWAGYRFFRTDNYQVMFDGSPNEPYAQLHAFEFGVRIMF